MQGVERQAAPRAAVRLENRPDVVEGDVVDLSVKANTVESHTVIEVGGEVDVHSAAHLRDRLTATVDAGARSVIVDLTGLGFIDSTGLGALVAARNHAVEQGASLRLVCPSERLLKLFRITGLTEVFQIYPGMAEALAAG